MPRKSRDAIKTSYFHVMVQGINKSYIFEKDEEAKEYISLMYKIKNEYNIKILVYCVMKNHCHMLVKCYKIEDLSSFMKKLNLSYAIYYNKKYNRVGYVFRDRFKSQAIISEKHFYNCIHYIYNNPVKAKICKNPKEYPYLNYRENLDILKEVNDTFEFLEIEDEKESDEILIKRYLENKRMNINDIKENKEELFKLVKYLRETNQTSYRKIEELLGIGRETARRMIEK